MMPSEPHVDLTDWINALRFSEHRLPIEDWKPYMGPHVIFTLRGRTAVALAIQILKLSSNDCILFPAYHCGCELEVIINSKILIKFYDVNMRAEPLLDLTHNPPTGVRALYVIHPFGNQLALDDIHAWCIFHGLYLIEDCASIIPSLNNKLGVGCYGDVAIFSPRKFIGTNYGGILTVKPCFNTDESKKLRTCKRSVILREIFHNFFPNGISSFRKIKLLLGSVQLTLACVQEHGKIYHQALELTENCRFWNTHNDYRASHPWFKILMQSVSWNEISKKRITNYKLLMDLISDLEEVKPLIESLPHSMVPLNFPVLVNNRGIIIQRMKLLGIQAVPWWSYFHPALNPWSNFPNAFKLKNNIITLPIHQGLKPKQINQIANSLIHATLD